MIVHAYRVLFLLVPLVVGSCAEREGTQFVVPLQNDPYLTVRPTFKEQAAWFMFDTGAGAHTLARWFVDAAGMATEDDLLTGVQARDAAGQPVLLQAIRNAAGRLADGRSIVLESVIVADFPPKFQDEEVGGLLNPQLLASDGQAVVLDLRVPELRFERLDHAVRRIGARTLAQDEFQVCSEADAPIPNLLYAVAVTARDQT
ncbi:MAG TPA: hypothetical protein VMN76_09240, partial [Acidobacteriota bacterium]|nr:hypothetical protein [Acidobacteriota bacterium]